MIKIAFFMKAVLFLFFLSATYQYGSIDPYLPTKISVTNQGLSSIYTFTLKFQTPIQANNYLMINFSNYTSAISPKSCFYAIYPNFPNNYVTCSVPNSDSVVFVLMPFAVSSNSYYVFVIEIANINPISSMGSAFELKTVSSTDSTSFFIYDNNPNFEAIPFTPATTNTLTTSLYGFSNSNNYKLPKSQLSISISAKINVDLEKNPRIKLVLAYPWQFLSTNTLTVDNDPKYIALSDSDSTKSDYKAPSLLSYKIESPLEAYLIFNEDLTKGKSFLVKINNFINPDTYSTIFLKVFTMNYNSNSAIESSVSNIQLQTLQNPLVVSMGLASKIPLSNDTAGTFYKNSKQYIQINVTSSQSTPDNSIVTIIIGSTNEIIKGSVSLISGFNPYNASLPIDLSYSTNTLRISNVKSISSNDLLTVTLRIRTSTVDSYINAQVSFDTDISASVPSFYGVSNSYTFQSNAYTIISSFTLNMDPTNTFTFTITPSTDDTASDSYLEIYFSRFIKFTGNPTCSITAPSVSTISDCPLTDFGNYYYLKLVSPTGTNMFPSTGITVSIGGFTLTDCSNHQDKIYEFYSILKYDNTATSPKLFLMLHALALPTRNSFSNFYQSISNNLYWTTLNYNYPSIINLVGTASDFTAISLSSGSQRFISVFAYKSFKNLFGTNLVSNSSFPCGSNLDISCVYIEGDSQTYLSSSDFLDWDRVNIYLPETIPEDFHIALPDIFLSDTYVYEIYFGTVSAASIYTYLHLETQLSITPSSLLTSYTADTNLQMQNSGFAAAKINNFKLDIYTTASHTGNTSPNFGAALFIVTDWELWVSGTSSASGSAFGTLTNSPVNFHYIASDNLHYFVLYIPLVNAGALNAGLVSYLNGVFNPFSLDLPNYVIYTTRSNSQFDSYNAFFNAGANSYTSTQIKSMSFTCTDLRDNEKNTFCSLKFQTNNRIESNGNIRLIATGLTFHTSACNFNYLKSSSLIDVASFSCSALDSAHSTFGVSLSLDNALSNDNVDYFNLSFHGIDIDTSGTGSILLDLSVRDFSNNYIIENLTKAFAVSPQLLRFHVISSISLEYYSSGAVTQMNLTVNFPRNLYNNEKIVLDLGADLKENNQNSAEIQAFFYNYITKTPYLIYLSFSGSLITFNFLQANTFISAGTYIFILNGIKLPATTPKTALSVYFTRNYDQKITLSSYSNSTSSFPQLVEKNKPNIQILETKYLLESHITEFNFEVTIFSSSLDASTVIVLNFPEYYSPSLFNDANSLYCGINKLKVSCETSVLYPYRLTLTDFPVFFYVGSTFNITIYGILNPKYSNRILSKYLNSTIMFGVDQYKNGSFSEIANLVPPEVLPLPTSFNYLILLSLYINNTYAKDFATHTFELIVENIAIPANSGFLINFLEQYTSLENLESVQCNMSYINSDGLPISISESCEVQGKRIKGLFLQNIPANTAFNISLYSIPTVDAAGTIDPNNMLISIFGASEIEILSYTKSQINRAEKVSFINKLEDIELNNGQQIVLTQGTYYPNIIIEPNDGSRFVNNMLLNASLTGFEFIPSSLSVLLGDFSSSFQVGADKDLLNGLYSFSFQKKEFGFQNIYGNLAPVFLFLTTNPIKITVPEELIVNIYGCNLPYIVNVTYTPYSSLILNFMLDYDIFGETFFVDNELNSYASIFLFNNTISNLVFCTSAQFNPASISTSISLSLTGINPESYYLSNSQIRVIFQNSTQVSPPLANSSINYIGRTEVSLKIDVNCDGLLFWRLVSKEHNTKNRTGEEIRVLLYNNNFSEIRNESNSYDSGTYEIMNYMIVKNNSEDSSVNNTIVIKGLVPSHEYEFFAFVRSNFREMGQNFTYVNFSTQNLANFTKILAVYNRTIYSDEINSFYCYLVRMFQTKSRLIVSSASESCSFYFDPSSYYYQYTGQSFSDSANQTYLYFIPDPELEQDTALEKINEYFDTSSKLVSDVILGGGKKYGIDYLSEMKLITQFNQSLLYNAQSPFDIPQIVNISFGVFNSKYNSSILVKNLTLSGDGAVYFIMEPYQKTLEDSEFQGEYYNETIQTISRPTGDQIKNCLNALNKKASVCFRAFFYNNQSYDIEIRRLESYTVYKVFYMLANENPLFPTYNSSQIYEAEALSYTIYSVKIWSWKLFEIFAVILVLVFAE